MARIGLAPEIFEDFDRIVEHLLRREVADVSSRLEDIMGAIDVLERNPRIGRHVHLELRELVIGRGTRGYVALYRYVSQLDVVFVLAIRAQREAGHSDSDI